MGKKDDITYVTLLVPCIRRHMVFYQRPLRSDMAKVRNKAKVLSDHVLLFQENCQERFI